MAARSVVGRRPPDDLAAEGRGVGHGGPQNGTLIFAEKSADFRCPTLPTRLDWYGQRAVYEPSQRFCVALQAVAQS